MSGAPDAGIVHPDACPDAIARSNAGRLVRALLVLQVVTLVLVRLFRDADDFSDWDLIPFLNANSFGPLWKLLQRPEIHLRKPFVFSMNVGAESVPSAVLLHSLSQVSLYWANALVLLVYDALFFFLVFRFFALVFADRFTESVAWALLAMSPIILTFASTSAFNMQGYASIALGLLGCEYVLQRRAVLGTVLLTLAFCVMPQGYPLGLFLPYFALTWLALRAVMVRRSLGRPRTNDPQRTGDIGLLRIAACGVLVLGLVAAVNYASGKTYVETISPLATYGPYASVPPGQWSKLGERVVLFLRQSFVPFHKVDGVPVGFAPYFVYATVAAIAVVVLLQKAIGCGMPAAPYLRPSSIWGDVVLVVVAAGTVIAGYVPAFLSQIVKSQRAVFGDLFLVVVAAHWIGSTRERHRVRASTIAGVLAVLLCASDTYYLYFTLSVDHSKNHSPVFDFDLSDGVARHDLVAAIERMRQQVEDENAAVVIYFPLCYTENHTDPAVFFARFLRHFGPYAHRRDLIFPCRWCEVKYGCPFPAVRERRCSASCCYDDPLFEIRSQRRAGKRVFLWWWREPRSVRDTGRWGPHNDDLAADSPRRLLRAVARRYALKQVVLPPIASGWICFELVEK